MTKDCSWKYHENYKRRTWAEHGNSMNNLMSYCGLIDAKIRASDKDLPLTSGRFFSNFGCLVRKPELYNTYIGTYLYYYLFHRSKKLKYISWVIIYKKNFFWEGRIFFDRCFATCTVNVKKYWWNISEIRPSSNESALVTYLPTYSGFWTFYYWVISDCISDVSTYDSILCGEFTV